MSALVEAVARAFGSFASLVCIPVIAAIIVADVFCRYVLNAPLFWAQDVTTLVLLLVFFCAQPIAFAEDVHIRMDLIYGRYGPRMRALADVMTNLVIAFVSGLFAYRMVNEMLDPFARGDTHGFLKVPLAPFRAIVAMVMVVLVLQAISRAIRAAGART
jgi:TRAP-type C4-dicarboxylate transport system permease small subunit